MGPFVPFGVQPLIKKGTFNYNFFFKERPTGWYPLIPQLFVSISQQLSGISILIFAPHPRNKCKQLCSSNKSHLYFCHSQYLSTITAHKILSFSSILLSATDQLKQWATIVGPLFDGVVRIANYTVGSEFRGGHV